MIQLKQNASIHMIAICGTGMGSLAGLLHSKGYQVRGSDQNVYPPMSTQLQNWGIPVIEGFRVDNLAPKPDLVIVGNAMSRGNPEIEALLESGIPYISFPQAIAQFFLTEKESLVVAGTHGKSTTSAFLAYVLANAGLEPGYLIGAVPQNLPRNCEPGTGKYFVIEGDEYDTAFFDKKSKFLHYQPKRVILTSCEFDHADIFEDFSVIENAFTEFIQLIPPEGALIACKDQPKVMELADKAPTRVITYGFHPEADVRAKEYKFSDNGCTFELWVNNKLQGTFHSLLIGKHNLQNALGVVALCIDIGMDFKAIQQGLATFQGIRRRQEILANQPFLVLDDFAHHPTAISETLAAVKGAYPDRKVLAVFEPRSNTSVRNYFQKELAESLALADHVFIGAIHRSERIPEEERLNLSQVVSRINQLGSRAFSGSTDDLEQEIQNTVKKNDLILFMSNGSFDNLPHRIAEYAIKSE